MTYFRRLILASALVAAPAAAQTFEDLDVLQGRVVASLGAEIGEPGGPTKPLDRRLKLAACPELAVVEAPALGAVTVRCAPIGWRIRVPLIKSAGVGASETAAAAAPAVRKGDQVELLATGGAFTISMVAVAEEDGAPGERIRVRSEPKEPPIIAEVARAGRVFLPGFK